MDSQFNLKTLPWKQSDDWKMHYYRCNIFRCIHALISMVLHIGLNATNHQTNSSNPPFTGWVEGCQRLADSHDQFLTFLDNINPLGRIIYVFLIIRPDFLRYLLDDFGAIAYLL
ncbi:Extracellular endo-inulinase inu2 [Dirofilaria immitis]